MFKIGFSIDLVNRSRPGARHPGEDQEFVENECVLGARYRDRDIRDGVCSVSELPGEVDAPTFDLAISE
jgi:hypothetical protein